MSYKWWVLTAFLLFALGLVSGLFTPTGITNLIFGDLNTALRELSGIVVPFSIFTVAFIFAKNAISLLISFVLSPILCLVPILTLAINGWVVALVATTVIQEESVGYLLAGMLPHGIFEIPAFIIGEAAALSFGVMLIRAPFKKRGERLPLPRMIQNLKFLAIALGLLIPAAIIETYVTPLLLTLS
jgi:stage II sporulation protein M